METPISDVIETALRDIDINHTIPVIGSGLSIACGYPTWTEAANMAAIAARRIIEVPETLEATLAPPIFFEHLKAKLTPSDYHAVLLESFSPSDSLPAPSAIHRLLAKCNFPLIITTNYDPLLEDAIAKAIGRSALIAQLNASGVERINSAKHTVVLKMHGCLNEPSSMVATTSDYNSLYSRNPAVGELKRQLQRNRVVFLGYGLTEPDFLGLWTETRDFIGYSVAGAGICFRHKGAIDNSLADSLRSKDIRVCEVDEHPDSWTHLSIVAQTLLNRSVALQTQPDDDSAAKEQADKQQTLSKYIILRLDKSERTAEQHFFEAYSIAALVELPPDGYYPIRAICRSIESTALPFTLTVERRIAAALTKLTRDGVLLELDGGFQLTSEYRDIVKGEQVYTSEGLVSAATTALAPHLDPTSPATLPLDVDGLISLADSLVASHTATIASALIRQTSIDNDLHSIGDGIDRLLADRGLLKFKSASIQALAAFFAPPNENARKAVDRLARSHLVAQSFLIDPETNLVARDFAAGHHILLDTNFALPLLAEHHPYHNMYASILTRSQQLGIKTSATEGIVAEVRGNLAIAVNQIHELRRDRLDVREVMTVYAELCNPSESNPFILGYAIASKGNSLTWEEYAGDLLQQSNRRPDIQRITDALASWKVTSIPQRELPAICSSELEALTNEIVDYRGGRRGLAHNQHRKLSRCEARHVLTIRALRHADQSPHQRVWFLTTDGHLPKICNESTKWGEAICRSPLNWDSYLDLIEPSGSTHSHYSDLIGRVARTGLSDKVARRVSLGLAKRRAELNATDTIALTDLATEALSEETKRSLEESAKLLSNQRITGRDFNQSLDQSIQEAIRQSTSKYVLARQEDLDKHSRTRKELEKVKYRLTLARRELTGKKRRRRRR